MVTQPNLARVCFVATLGVGMIGSQYFQTFEHGFQMIIDAKFKNQVFSLSLCFSSALDNKGESFHEFSDASI